MFRRLEPGNSGSVVYEERKGRVNREVKYHRPLGMFIGRPADAYLYPGRDVYQAIVLKQALDDIATDYNEKITDIQTFTY